MSLTSYRAAPPRVGMVVVDWVCLVWMTWRRPTFPRLEPQYHGRWRFSRSSSGWDRVWSLRHGHQVVQTKVLLAGVSLQASEASGASDGLGCRWIWCAWDVWTAASGGGANLTTDDWCLT